MNTLIELITKFKKYNNSIAIINKTEFRTFTWAYSKLYLYIKKFSAFLEKNNIKKGDKITILSQNSPEYVIIFLGAILKGVILVPIDIRSTNDFIDKIINQTQPKLLFITKYKNINLKIKKIYLEDLEYLLEGISPSEKKTKITKKDIVEIVYTSGTTGIPKGVILTNENITSNITSLKKVFRLDQSYRFLSLLPLSHLFEQTVGLFTPLNSGSSIVYISSLKPSEIINALNLNITNIVLVPRLLQLLKDKILLGIKNAKKEKQFNLLLKLAAKIKFEYRKFLFLKIHRQFKNLKFFILGGAPLSAELESFWELMGFKIVQGYGLTEASPVISCNSPYQRKLGSVGKILPDIIIKLGADNEILAKGNNITQGYYKNKEETKQLFINRWMRTGDIGYLDKEDFLFIKGRKKDMIVTSEGINIYPEDIEAILNKIEGVKESCVIGLKKGSQEEIHAVLLLENEYKNKARHILNLANSKLPPYQQIQGFTVWRQEDFPRTPTMKIKKNIVIEMLIKKIKPEVFLIKKDKLYSIIAGIKNISTDKIKPSSRLVYDLNLSSVDRIELISAIEQEFNIDIEEDLITDKTTIRQLKDIIKRRISTHQPYFRKGSLSLPIKIIRYLAQILIAFPIIKIFCRAKTEGKENLKHSPVIFVSNHTSHFDAPLILSKLPFRFKTNIAIATWAEFFQAPKNKPFKKLKKTLLYNLGIIFLNLYMFFQTKSFMKSIKYTGELIDKNSNILIFPEGERTRNGNISPFKLGIGMIVSNMKVPVVPIKLEGLFQILPRGANFPKKIGKVKVKFGKYLYFKNESYLHITKKIEDEVKSL